MGPGSSSAARELSLYDSSGRVKGPGFPSAASVPSQSERPPRRFGRTARKLHAHHDSAGRLMLVVSLCCVTALHHHNHRYQRRVHERVRPLSTDAVLRNSTCW